MQSNHREPPDTAWAEVRLTASDAERFPLLWDGDVLVAGGGSAGCAAAVAAGRAGAGTLIVEPSGFFGGTAVAVLDTMYGFFPAGSDDERVVGGIGWELVTSLLNSDQAFLRGNTYGAGIGVTYEPEALKLAWDGLLAGAGVELLLHATITAVVMDGPDVVGVVVHTDRGPFRIQAQRFVDSTGDGVLAWAAGCALEMPDGNRRVQPLTTTFRVGGVGAPPATAELHRLMREAAGSGHYQLPRLEGSSHRTVLPGVQHTNMTRVSGVDSTNPWARTAAEIEGRRQAHEYARFLRDRVPGYEHSYLLGTSVWIGTRETRRLIGAYVLTRDDVIAARHFDDAIALCGAPVEDHDAGDATLWQYVGGTDRPTGRTYGIPFGCLLPVDVDNLVVAGRCLSATHDAHASARSIGQCLAYGQAAGTAAALSARQSLPLSKIDVQQLRRTLVSDGAVL